MHAKTKETRTRKHNSAHGSHGSNNNKNDPRTRCMLQGWPPSAPRLPGPPGSPRLGLDSVGNFVLFGRAAKEQRRRGYGWFLELRWKQSRASGARSCHATAPRSSSSEAAVSTRHRPIAAGKCGRVVVEITTAGTKQAIIWGRLFERALSKRAPQRSF